MQGIGLNNSSLNFKSLTLKPKAQDWNKDVLNAALDSRYVHDFIDRNTKNREDIVMSFTETIPDEHLPYSFKIMNFGLKSKSQSMSVKSVAKPKMEKSEVVYTDIYDDKKIKDVGKDLASQISDFGVIKSELSESEKLRYLYMLANEK
jgi:hypothetical protein